MDTRNVFSERNCILLIDDDKLNREMMQHIFSSRYDCVEAQDGLEGLKMVEAYEDRLCAILLDVSMPVMNGLEFLRIVHSRGITKRIPVFMVTVSTEYEIVQEGYELGVMDVITKPVQPFIIMRRIENIIELFKARENLSETVIGQAKQIKENVDTLDTIHRSTMEALASAIEFRDVESGEHTSRMYNITKHILTKTDFGSGLTEDEIEDMSVAAIMHDIGKIAISDVILNKPGKLTVDEFEVMKGHTEKGELLLEQIARIQSHGSYKYACDIARHHHERWDGHGYPDGLKGEEISVCAQVASIADVYDALVTPRVYKKAYTPDKAVKMILDGECGIFNPALVESFLKVEPEIRQWYKEEEKYWGTNATVAEQKREALHKLETDSQHKKNNLNREVADILLLMAAVQSVYDMIICVNLTKNSYYMIDYERFLTHCAGYDGVFDELIAAGALSVPEPYREAFVNSFCRENLLEAYKQGKKSVHLEHPQFSDNGEKHMVSTTVMFVEDPKTEDVLEITLARYIDGEWEEKEKTKQILKDALSVAEKANAAKSDFLSRISHDIRTPLNAIMGMTTIIGANAGNEEIVRECVSKIGVSSKHLLALINNVLDFSQIESGNMSIVEAEFNMRELLEEVQTIVAERVSSKNQRMDIQVSDEVERIYKGDAFRVRQILINLLDNAHKYTAEGGRYSLSVTVGKKSNMYHYVVFSVEDNGIGICEDCIEKMFNPFVQCGDTTDNKGVGLGLAITRNLVHLMDGKMDVESKVGVGTRFIVELPFQIGVAEDELCVTQRMDEKTVDDDKEKYNGEKILVAEDNELNQDIIKTILEMENLQVDIAANGQEAVEKFMASEPGEYLVIFMDVAMPVMDGYEATRIIRKSSHVEAETMPIYALTANAFYSDVVEAKASGMNGHLAKPIDFAEVSQILCQAVAERETKKG